MATYSDNFNRADGNLASPWAASVGAGAAIVTNVVKAATGSGYRISALTGETFDNDQEAQVTLVAINTSDYAGPCVRMDGSGNGYFMSCQFIDGRVYLYRMTGGVQTSLGFISSTPVATDTVKLGVVGTTFTYYLNGVPQGTWSDATYSSGSPGIGFNPGGSNNTTVDDFTSEGWATATASLDDVNTDEVVDNGETGITLTTSNFGGDINSAKITDGTNETLLTSLAGTAGSFTANVLDIKTITTDTAGAPFTSASNSLSMSVTDGTDTATLAITYQVETGYAVQEITNASTAQGSVFENFVGTPPNGSQVYYATANNTSVSATGILTTDNTSNFYMWYWDSVTGLWDRFEIIVGATIPVASRASITTLIIYLQSQGYGRGNDAIKEWLIAEGYTTGALNDRMYAYLDDLGFAGALSDKLTKWKNE